LLATYICDKQIHVN